MNSKASDARRHLHQQVGALLFDISLADIDNATTGVNYDYNYFGEGAEVETSCTGYAGGHAGTDLQTKDVEGSVTADRNVFSLTGGDVLSTDAANGRVFMRSAMAFDGTTDMVKIGYLHLRTLAVRTGDTLAPGAKFGVQGNLGLGLNAADTTTREHVHVEIRADAAPTGAACGAAPKGANGHATFAALDPQKYFAAIVKANPPKK